ncbi:PREDICTED: replication protein A 70 kDa DNA-binding subunit E-like [Camelina sativa]|uniref:Replication protein A 70 kDa DNA-binding subunit E-like n=1 Tax=Camelina sativa TaxID=90675 RepID=A0ABM0YX32_CAMSA|nr:PREDICTED: replication protein A 70 kDa DNA-binding subunit E-like [Camelina sativa]
MTSLLMSTFISDRGTYFGVGSLGSYINGKRKFPGSSSSFTSLQQQLKEANRKIEQQAALQAERDAEASRVVAEALRVASEQQAEITRLSFESITAEDGLNEHILIDVVGQVVNIGTMKTSDNNGKVSKRLEEELRDISDNRVTCTLWDSFADKMWAAGENAGERSISNVYDMSFLLINSDYPSVLDFVGNLPKDGISISFIQPKAAEPKADKKIDYFNRFERRTISELLESTMEGKFKIMGSIFNIDMDFGWYYFTCIKCDKPVYLVPKKENDPPSKVKKRLFHCNQCYDNTTKVQPRYKLILDVMDSTAKTKVMLWDNNAQKLVNKTASEILDGNFDEIEDPTNIPEALKSLVGKTYQFLATIDKGNINDGKDTYKVSLVEVGSNSDHVDNIEDSEQMIDPSTIVSTDQGHTVGTYSTEIEDGLETSPTTPSSKRKEDAIVDLLINLPPPRKNVFLLTCRTLRLKESNIQNSVYRLEKFSLDACVGVY